MANSLFQCGIKDKNGVAWFLSPPPPKDALYIHPVECCLLMLLTVSLLLLKILTQSSV